MKLNLQKLFSKLPFCFNEKFQSDPGLLLSVTGTHDLSE